MAAPTFSELRRQIAGGHPAPVYILHGKENYYIDRLLEDFTALVPEDERDFNLYTFYGAEAQPHRVDEACRRFPMMADRVVVILKEAQAMSAPDVNKLAPYVSAPNASTVFVIAFRGEMKGADLAAAAKKSKAVVFESKELRDYNVGPVIADLVREKGLNIEQKGLMMLRDYIGADVAKIYNEVEKLAMILGKGAMITPEAIERNVGISKDYNAYELVDALGSRDAAKALRIVEYFRANPKGHSSVMMVPPVFNFFATLITLQFSRDKSQAGLMAAAGFKQAWQLRNYEAALRNYNARQSMEIISAIRRFDTRSKGVESRWNEYDLLRQLVFEILNARGVVTL